jgi:cellulose synthase/poly-beta-1,6-N-acetylglucosamine synthase-like glycosyltransferase
MITFIIPAHDEELLIGQTINALHDAASATSEPYEIIVVDDASTDATTKVAARCGARIVSVHYRQIAAARNAGAAHAQGDLLVFVDADTHVPGTAVGAALHAVRLGAVGGGSRARFDGLVPIYGRFLVWVWLWIQQFGHLASGCFLFCTRRAFEAAGGFDQTLYAAEDGPTELASQTFGSICGLAGGSCHIRTEHTLALTLRVSADHCRLRTAWPKVLQNPTRAVVWSTARRSRPYSPT